MLLKTVAPQLKNVAAKDLSSLSELIAGVKAAWVKVAPLNTATTIRFNSMKNSASAGKKGVHTKY